jgi:uncharacterized protein YxjI
MTLYIKQKVFSFNDKFTVKDADGVDKYRVEGEIFTIGRKLHVYDNSEREAIFIKERLTFFMPVFEIYIDGNLVGEVKREFTFFHPRYTVTLTDGRSINVDGDFWDHDYSVTEGTRTLMSVSKEYFTWGDSYALNVFSAADEKLGLAIVLAIDCVLAQNNN